VLVFETPSPRNRNPIPECASSLVTVNGKVSDANGPLSVVVAVSGLPLTVLYNCSCASPASTKLAPSHFFSP
jgi:hypothetical protein